MQKDSAESSDPFTEREISVSWIIYTFDRKAKKPLPLLRKHYELDWTKASKAEKADILDILKISPEPKSQIPPDLNNVKCTFSVGVCHPDNRMLKYRHLFVEIQAEDITKVSEQTQRLRSLLSVNLRREYFEDETGTEISMQDIGRLAFGNDRLILFECENIAKIGPTEMLYPETWSPDKANTIFNFIQVIRVIWNSDWARARSSVSFHKDGQHEQELIECTFPQVCSMSSVLTLFRQLYGRDTLMENTCKGYLQHCADGVKKQWIKERHELFDTYGKSRPDFIDGDVTVFQLLNQFLYSTGLVHSASHENINNRKKFSSLVSKYGREMVLLAVNNSFWQILGYSIDVFHIVKQDYEYWIGSGKCAAHDIVDIYSLLKSTKKS